MDVTRILNFTLGRQVKGLGQGSTPCYLQIYVSLNNIGMDYEISYTYNGVRTSIRCFEYEAESYIRNLAHWMLQGFKFHHFNIKAL